MSGFENLIGQQRPVRMLSNALARGRMPQAWLFTGETGVGKKTAAIELAKAANCINNAGPDGSRKAGGCGICRACKKISAGIHPDIHTVTPAGAHIRIDQVRTLCRNLALKSDEASMRFVLIAEAQQMNAEAANALLKILEEPPEATVFVLTAPDTADLLPTIVSRCQHIRFHPVARPDLEKHLVEQYGVEPDHAMIVASLARGSLSRALEMVSEDWLGRRRFVIDQLRQLPAQPHAFRHAFAEMLAADKARLGIVLEIVKNWYRDLAVYSRSPAHVYNRDLSEELGAVSTQMPVDAILEKTDAVAHAEKALAGNANARLVMEALLLKLAQ